jgi:ABC-type phosphate transport system ATPase subunit
MTHSNTEQLNDAFHAVHDEVNDNLDNIYLGQSGGQKKKRW